MKFRIFIIVCTIVYCFLLAGCKNRGRNININEVVKPVTRDFKTGRPLPSISIHEAALNGLSNEVMELLAAGLKVDTLDNEGRTALMYAAFNGHTEIIRKLLENGSQVNLNDIYGRTALMMASSGPYAETVKVLLDHYADPNIADKEEHFTAIMYAAAEGQLEVVKLLLAYKADPTLKDIDGDDAFSFATNNGHLEVAALLKTIKK